MSAILSTTIEHDGQSLEIFVKYDPMTNIATEIKGVFINSPIGKLPVGDLMTNVPELDVAINKIIERVDWREIHLHMKDWWEAA